MPHFTGLAPCLVRQTCPDVGHLAAPGVFITPLTPVAGQITLGLAPEDPSLVISLTAGDLGPFVASSTRVFTGVDDDVREETFSLAEDGIFLPDGAELTVTLRDAAGAEIRFVLDTERTTSQFFGSGVAVGNVVTSGTFLYEGAHASWLS